MGKLQHGEGGDTTETVSVAQEEVFQISKSQINKAKKKAKKKRLRDNELRERKKVWSLCSANFLCFDENVLVQLRILMYVCKKVLTVDQTLTKNR